MEVIDYGKYGMHFRNGNVVDLANKLETILKGGYDYKMIEPAFEYVKSHYDISISAKKYFDEYKKLL
jgi:glycosyltransferase involved in cell wall biosynthesis